MGRLFLTAVAAGFVIAVLLLSSCKDENNPVSPTVVFPDSAVSYAAHVQPLFNQGCTFGGCHDDGPVPSGLHLTSYGGLMFNALQVVVPRNPDQSVLVWRIEGTTAPQMPLYRNPLTKNQIDGIKTWIREGALNN